MECLVIPNGPPCYALTDTGIMDDSMDNDNEVKNLLATGAERFESAARNHMQARCVQLARMGCVVFQYDMLGYADSQQIDFNRAHRFGLAGPNPPVEDDGWLLYSPTAEGHLQSNMGLQTINTLQSFEFLASRPDVDPSKIAITGASGGGTQTFIAAALGTSDVLQRCLPSW